ncbi:ABC transporter permease [Syntrophotalea acetylenivorans]|uniref:ABC transporter permease n=1 Tax=Syntrophotalea acetylenivorans TaxID=1842532 RepID=A0A1L3GR06_9BACT|nr:ABC transporter permease [Syntrophotalea acetylenivorans]APG28290.1 ABC transporter permease [Syntrophotalea acetylenivorans]
MFFSLKIALSSLRAHRLRSILAMVGVFLGALALTGVQHVSRSMLLKAEHETAKLGTNLFMVRSGQLSFRPSGSSRVRGLARNFTRQDAKALLAGVPAARAGAPFVLATSPIRSGDLQINCQLVATLPSYATVRNVKAAWGRFLSASDEAERAKVCVLGASIARRLFGDGQGAVGQQVMLHRAGLRVIGVMEPKGADIAGTDQDEQVFVPLTTYMRRLANQDWISGVYLQLADSQAIEEARQAAATILRRRHSIDVGEDDDFTLLAAQDTMRVQRDALALVQTLGLLSSSISFAVGGLGILSIMVLLVRTRRLEIGVRRAVGAKRRDIVRQFMFEAGLMAGIGGGLGVLSSLLLVLVVCRIGEMPLAYDPVLIGSSLFGSLLLGLAAGAYPAWQAANVEILQVLRNE